MSKPSRPDGTPENVWQLFLAALDGEMDRVKELVATNPEHVNEQVWYEIPLFYAVRGGHEEVVRFLLDSGSNPAFSNFNYSSWQSLLPLAEERHPAIFADLLKEAKQRFNYDPAYPPLWTAVNKGDEETINSLLAAHPDWVNISDEHGNRAIHWAVLSKRIPVIELLLNRGADINALRADLQSPLHCSLIGDYWFGKSNQVDPDTPSETVTDFLLANNAEYEFSAAVAREDLPRVNEMLSADPELARKLNPSRRSPLFHACGTGNLELVRLLLDHGADPNLPESCADKGKALFIASDRNDLPLMKLLLKHGADADAYVDSSGNCLSIADQGGENSTEAQELLRQHGARPGQWTYDSPESIRDVLASAESLDPTEDMWAGLINQVIKQDDLKLLDQYVARFGTDSIQELNPTHNWRVPNSIAMFEKLLALGADLNRRDWYGRSFLHYIAESEKTDLAAWLIDNQADINALDHNCCSTPLGFAAAAGQVEMVKLLLDRGADRSLPANQPWGQPAVLAERHGYPEVANILAS